jgi:hypothetical protein
MTKKLSFTNAADIAPHKRLIIAIDGPDKAGKTHFGLSGPGDVYVHSFDTGLEGVVEKFRDKKVIQVAEYQDGSDPNEWWETFEYDYLEGSSKKARTCVWDTATEVWELLRLAKLGKLAQVPPVKYTEVNMLYRKLIRAAYDSDMNLILLHKVKEEWKDNKTTGNMIRAGFSEAGYLVQVNARMYFSVCSCKKPVVGVCSVCSADNKFHFVFVNCRPNMELVGTDMVLGELSEMMGVELTPFQEVALTIYPNSSPADWV